MLWNGIQTLPQAAIKRESIILEPIPFTVIHGEDEYNTSDIGILSHWNVKEIRNTKSRKRIQSILSSI